MKGMQKPQRCTTPTPLICCRKTWQLPQSERPRFCLLLAGVPTPEKRRLKSWLSKVKGAVWSTDFFRKQPGWSSKPVSTRMCGIFCAQTFRFSQKLLLHFLSWSCAISCLWVPPTVNNFGGGDSRHTHCYKNWFAQIYGIIPQEKFCDHMDKQILTLRFNLLKKRLPVK